MPHLRFDYSPDLEELADLDELCALLRDAMEATGLFPVGGIRVRGHAADCEAVGDGLGDALFLDIELKIGHGRSPEQKRAALEQIYGAARAYLEPRLAEVPFALSAELREIDPEPQGAEHRASGGDGATRLAAPPPASPLRRLDQWRNDGASAMFGRKGKRCFPLNISPADAMQAQGGLAMAKDGRTVLRGYESALPIALLRAREATMRRFKGHVDAHGVTLPQWRVIRALADGGPLDARTLAERCVILPPSLTRIFRALEDKGLIEQVETLDARRHAVRLTSAGEALYAEMSETSEGIYAELESAFGPEDMALLLRLLTRLRETAATLPERPAAG
jgi:homoprotocatechuate degradation regulator HpaR